DLQSAAKDKGQPWDWGKAFDRSAPCGPVHPVSVVGHLSKGSIKLTVNDQVKQDADLTELIWSIPEVISILSRSVALEPGDLIYTGTPAGVGPLVVGDVCKISIEGLSDLITTIAQPLG
ncbi:MAG: fumarylpyruvate hydrolase, partial [Paracoccaceae bacterium]